MRDSDTKYWQFCVVMVNALYKLWTIIDDQGVAVPLIPPVGDVTDRDN